MSKLDNRKTEYISKIEKIKKTQKIKENI